MKHVLKLQPKYFEYINTGTKRIELRLYDEKRQKINIGDTIIFKREPELEKNLKVKVIALLRYNSFDELLKDFNIEILADKTITKEELLNDLEKYYTINKQSKYGVVGIKIEKWYLFRKLEIFLSFRNNLLYLYEITESRREGLKKEIGINYDIFIVI